MIIKMLMLAACLASFAQPPRVVPVYTISRDVTPSAAASVVTVQQPSANARIVQFAQAYVYCAVACEITVERNGSAASSTAMTVYRNNPESTPAAAALAYHTSNVGAGFSLVGPLVIPAGTAQVLDLSDYQMAAAGTSNNLTIRTNAVSGRVIISIKWLEFGT